MSTLSIKSKFARVKDKLVPILSQPEFKTFFPSEDEYKKTVDILLRPITNKKERNKMMKIKIWRLNYCYNIVDKSKQRIPFVMNLSQFKVYLGLLKHSRIINLKSRQQGISTLWLVSFLDDCLYCNDVRSAMISIKNQQQQDLLRRANLIWEYMEPWAKKLIGTTKKSLNRTKELGFSNNSSLMIGNDFRGETLTNLHVSELGEIAARDPVKAVDIMEGSVQAVPQTGRVVIESTAKGENMFSKLYREAEVDVQSTEDLPFDLFYPIFLSWLDDPYCVSGINMEKNEAFIAYEKTLNEQGLTITDLQKNFWIAKHKTLGDGIFKEYPATVDDAFRASAEGAIYAKHYEEYANINVDLPAPYDKENFNWVRDEPVYVSFDLGLDDYTFMIWMQVVDSKLLILQEKSFRNAGIDTFSRYLHRYDARNSYRAPDDVGYKYAQLILPHDARRRNMDDKTSTPVELFRKKDWSVKISKSKSESDNNLVREIMSQIYINTKQCPLLHKAFLNYRKQIDNTTGKFKEKAVHDDFSHPMDSLRYGVKELYRKLNKSAYVGYGDKLPTL